MKRKILTVLLVAVTAVCLVFGLSACGDSQNNTNKETSQGFEFTLSADKESYSAKYVGLSEENESVEIIVPAIYNELPVKFLSDGAFFYRDKLETITIPESVEMFGNFTFQYNKNLTTINYGGTMEQWNKIIKGINWNYLAGDFTVICTDGKLDKDGNEIT